MPTYEYACTECDYQFEQFQSITASPLRDCPKCGRRTLRRLIGTGGGVLFRGSGFYQTDYRSESYKKAAEAEAKAAPGGSTGNAAQAGEAGSAADGKRKPPASARTGESGRRSASDR
jgi:putative FmdB family regulatory protein